MKKLSYLIGDRVLFERKALIYFKNQRNIVYLNSNNTQKTNVLAVSESDTVIVGEKKYGFISYNYKNQIENLVSNNFDGVGFPDKFFFSPEIYLQFLGNKVEVAFQPTLYSSKQIDIIINEIELFEQEEPKHDSIDTKARVDKEEYMKTVCRLKSHIQRGDVYEVNFCQEFFSDDIDIDPIYYYLRLNNNSPTPFSCFVKHQEKYLISASPERFIKKEGDRIISQPMKGTAKRGNNEIDDRKWKGLLKDDPKERSENIMIVDLVRNDLSRIARRNTVKVEELCGVYTFPQVHQMISTISAELRPEVSLEEILFATFPMGSMTGAPKLKAMELIERYERTNRGIYSGAVGYATESDDFDFNVVIRSISYNKMNRYLSYMVGGAITIESDPEREYDECMLKARAIMEVLN